MAQGTSNRDSMTTRGARLFGLEAAAKLLGGGRAAAAAIDVNERSWRAWVGGEREISEGVLTDTAGALEAHAIACQAHAAKLRAIAAGDVAPADPARIVAQFGGGGAGGKSDSVARFRALPRALGLEVARGRIKLEEAERCTCQEWPTHCANDCPLHGLEGEQ